MMIVVAKQRAIIFLRINDSMISMDTQGLILLAQNFCMRSRRKRPALVVCLVAAICCLAMVTSTSACPLPVFRYALERWRPAPFELTIYHNQPLSKEEPASIERINANREANLSIWEVDMQSQPTAEDRAAWATRPNDGDESPWVVVRYSERDYGGILWSGPASLPATESSPLASTAIASAANESDGSWMLYCLLASLGIMVATAAYWLAFRRSVSQPHAHGKGH